MVRRRALDIKKKILQILKDKGEVSLGELERGTNSNNLTVLTQVEELAFFDKVDIIKHEKNEKTGRPYTSVRLKPR